MKNRNSARHLPTHALRAVGCIVPALSLLMLGCAATATKPQDTSELDFYDGEKRVVHEARSKPKSTTEAMQRGEDAKQKGDFDRALFEYVQAYELDDKNAEAMYQVGAIQASRNNYEKAISALRLSLENDPNHAGAYEEIGLIQLKHRFYADAAVNIDKALELDANRWRSLNAKGVIADLNKDFTAAREFYMQAMVANPDAMALMNNLGYSYYLSGDWETARKMYRDLIVKNPDYEAPRKNLALIFVREEKYDQALELFRVKNTSAEASRIVGRICMMVGRYAEAESFLTEALAGTGEYDQALHELIKQARMLRITQPS